MKSKNTKRRLILINLFVVIFILLSVLAFFIIVDPFNYFSEKRNQQRLRDVQAILQAIKIDQFENSGTYISAISELRPGLAYMIGSGEGCDLSCSHPSIVLQKECVSLAELVEHDYLPKVPYDPRETRAGLSHSFYYLIRESGGGLTVGSCSEEEDSEGSTISISMTR